MRDANVSPVGHVLIEVAAPSNDAAPQGTRLAYIDDVASRWSGRPATDEEVAAVKRGAEWWSVHCWAPVAQR